MANATAGTGMSMPRHFQPSDIPRFAQLGVIASMQPTHCISDKKFCIKRIGPERAKGAYAWKSLADAGASIAFGTDYQVEPLNPMEGLYASVTRKDRLGEDGEGWYPEQKISMEDAIKILHSGVSLCTVHGKPERNDQTRLSGRYCYNR